eukprot:1753121-Rhodomonas_salina.1
MGRYRKEWRFSAVLGSHTLTCTPEKKATVTRWQPGNCQPICNSMARFLALPQTTWNPRPCPRTHGGQPTRAGSLGEGARRRRGTDRWGGRGAGGSECVPSRRFQHSLIGDLCARSHTSAHFSVKKKQTRKPPATRRPRAGSSHAGEGGYVGDVVRCASGGGGCALVGGWGLGREIE